MSHVRAQIRFALAEALMNLGETASRVYVNRSVPTNLAAGPAIVVRVSGEEIDHEASSNAWLVRRLVVLINGYCADTATLDDRLDQIGLEVEQAMAGVGRLGGLLSGPPVLINVQVGQDQTTETPVGRIQLEYRATVRTAQTDPQTAL